MDFMGMLLLLFDGVPREGCLMYPSRPYDDSFLFWRALWYRAAKAGQQPTMTAGGGVSLADCREVGLCIGGRGKGGLPCMRWREG